ncbi:MAG: fibronectin type III domain-containing protein [Bryobacteraceae bacterium]
MRTITSILMAMSSALALDNAVRITDRTAATQTGRPFTIHRWFAEDELCNFPQPYVDGVAASEWQSDRVNRWPPSSRCSLGAVKSALISFRATVAANATITVDFRNSANACSAAANEAACRAAGITAAQALDFSGGAWGAKMRFKATPQGATTPQTADARAMLASGNCWAYLSGPTVTQYVCGPYLNDGSYDQTRPYALGFASTQNVKLAAPLSPTDVTIPVRDATPWAGLATPFKIFTASFDNPERINICAVDVSAKQLTICSGGRGLDGTTAAFHYPGYGNDLWLIDSNDLRLSAGLTGATSTIPLVDASAVTVPAVIQVAAEKIRVCAKSGNNLTAGLDVACNPNSDARAYYGSNPQTYSGGRFWHAGQPVYFSQSWMNAPSDNYKSISPVFVLTFFAGWTGVGIEYVYEDSWTDRIQDQEFDVDFLRGTADTVVTAKTGIRLAGFARHHYPEGTNSLTWTADRKIWDGATPGEVRYDFNLPYMRYAGLVPYDPSVQASAGMIANELTNNSATQDGNSPAWDNGSKCALESLATTAGAGRVFSGPVDRLYPSPGGRPDIALNPRWLVSGLFAMASALPNSHRWWEWTIGTGYCGGYAPVHLAEHKASAKFCDKGSSSADPSTACTGANVAVSAFGYPVSRHARPSINIIGQAASTASDDQVLAVGVTTLGGYSLSQSDAMAHFPDVYWIPYVLTGDWYFYWGVMHHAAYATQVSGNPTGCYLADPALGGRQSCSHLDWGLFGYIDGQRNLAWAFREVGRGAVAARDGSPEKELFTRTINANIAALEGMYSLTNGSFYQPCPAPLAGNYDYSFWCLGFWFRGNGDPNVGVTIPGHGYGGVSASPQFGADWMTHFILVSMTDLENQGLTQVRPIRARMSRRLLNMLTNRTQFLNPFAVSAYYAPWAPAGPDANTLGNPMAFANFADVWAAVPSTDKALTTFVNDDNTEGGYARIAMAAASALPDGVTDGALRGTGAWDWISGNIRYRQFDSDNAMWVYSPKNQHRVSNIRVIDSGAGTATVRFVRPANASSCSYTAGTARPASSFTTGETVLAAGNREMSIALTGLASGTQYHVRITCRDARGEVSFTKQ